MVLALLAVSSQATTFYVSPDGSDTAAGTSPATAWRTLLSASTRSYSPGDSLLLERNSTFFDDPLIVSSRGLSIGAYGNASLPRPTLQMGRAAASATTCATFLDADRTEIRNLHVSGCSTGISIVPPAGANGTNVLIERLYFNDIRPPFAHYTPPNPAWAQAIQLGGGHLNNLTVRNCFAVRLDVFFSSSAFVDGMTLSANTVQQCSGNCYSLGSGVNLSMRDSVSTSPPLDTLCFPCQPSRAFGRRR